VGAAAGESRFAGHPRAAFDERFGSTAAREAIMSGADPDVVMQRQQAAVQTFLDRARRFRIYQ